MANFSPKSLGGCDRAILSHIVNGSIQDFFKFNVDASLFEHDYKIFFEKVIAHIKEYKNIPSKETLIGFDSAIGERITEEVPPEPITYYIQERLHKMQFVIVNTTLKKSSDLLKEHDLDAIVKLLGEAQASVIELNRTTIPYSLDTDVLKSYANYKAKMLHSSPIYTGWKAIDNEMPGVRKGEIACLIGRPSSGKSMGLQQIANHASRVQGMNVLFYSCEMDKELMQFRNTSIDLGINTKQFYAQEITTFLTKRIAEFNAEVKHPIVFCGTETNRPLTLEIIRSDFYKYQPNLIMIDAAYLMRSEEPKGTPEHIRIANLVNGLKMLAIELDTVIFCAFQANRETVRKSKKDQGIATSVANISGSDHIGMVSSLVIYIEADEDEDEDGNRLGTKTLTVWKNRNGRQNYCFNIFWDHDKGNFKQAHEFLYGNESDDASEKAA